MYDYVLENPMTLDSVSEMHSTPDESGRHGILVHWIFFLSGSITICEIWSSFDLLCFKMCS